MVIKLFLANAHKTRNNKKNTHKKLEVKFTGKLN